MLDNMVGGPRFLLGLALFALGALACSPLATAPPSAPLVPTTPQEPLVAPPPNDPPPVATCPLTVRLETRPTSDGHELTVFAESATTSTQEIELPDRCPQGLVDFDGLGPAY